ncbi:MAG TPA: two-component regulator propeller domain-containing protein [Lacipirellulaceae bacterium]
MMFSAFCVLLTAESFAQDVRPDWHSGDYAGRDLAMWKVISEDLKTSFPRGGAPVEVKPFLQDDRLIFPLPESESNAPRSLTRAGERPGVILHTSGGQFYFDGKSLLPELKAASEDTVTFSGAIYAVRNDRLVRLESGKATPILDFGRDGLPDDEVRDIALSPDGELYASTASGIGILSKDGKWRHLTGRNGGLPVEDVTCLSFAADGTLWVGTKVGAARRRPSGEWNYRIGPRWMVGDEVIDVLATSQGGAYILTRKSLTHLFTRKMTLREKAIHYDAIARARHVRHGAVTSCNLRDVNDFDSWYMTDNDNDGLWTSIYLGAKCFEYAATKNPEAKRIAKEHFNFLHRLQTINGVPGFLSRSLRPSKDAPGGHEEYHYGGEGEWHESTVEPGWQWKADTSSDELSGHFFAWGVYYDYVAKGDPAEERRVEELVRRVTNHIIDHDFTLTDVDGHPTRWAIYSPRLLHGDLMWSDQVGFNALGILAHLKVAIHICGDQKFKDAYRMLIDRWGYNVKAMFAKEMLPNTPGAGINHSDDEMAWLEYYHLLLYPDKDERLRWQYRYSATRSMRPEIPERSSFFNFVFATDSPQWAHVADGVDTLKRWPLDLRQFETRNSHRADVIVDPRRGRHGSRLLLEPVPIDERVPKKWNHDPYVADDGGDGSHEESGAEWLMPYWMAVYHKLIVEVE